MDPFEVATNWDPLDDRCRWCVYCGADCWPERENQRHAADCATSTGVYPVREREVAEHGQRCAGCLAELVVGDPTMLQDARTRDLVTNPGEDSVSFVLCMGCAARVAAGTETGAVDA